MPLTETARKNHDALFPGHVSTLAVTDPELIEIFDNFAFDEILAESTLDARLRLMTQLAAIIACQAPNEYRFMLGAALDNGVTPVEAKEILYQAVPYVGIARAFDFLHATNDVLKARGVALPLPGQSTTTPETERKKDLGSRSRSSARPPSSDFMRRPRLISSTSSAICRRIASAIIIRGAALMCRRAKSSRSVCSRRSAAVTLR